MIAGMWELTIVGQAPSMTNGHREIVRDAA